MAKTAWYNGIEYLLLWAGPTPYGYRAKLAFKDNPERVFWVDRAKLVSAAVKRRAAAKAAAAEAERCDACEAFLAAEDAADLAAERAEQERAEAAKAAADAEWERRLAVWRAATGGPADPAVSD